MSRFESVLGHCPPEFRTAIINVCDTCEMAQRWWECRAIPYTAADVLQLAMLILAEMEKNKLGDAP